MNLKYCLYAILLACSFFVQVGMAQVTNVKYQMRYNTTTCRYDCYLIIYPDQPPRPNKGHSLMHNIPLWCLQKAV